MATSDSPRPFAPLTRTFANCLRSLKSIGHWRGHTNANDDNAADHCFNDQSFNGPMIQIVGPQATEFLSPVRIVPFADADS